MFPWVHPQPPPAFSLSSCIPIKGLSPGLPPTLVTSECDSSPAQNAGDESARAPSTSHLNDVLFGLNQQLVLQLFSHLHVEELVEGTFDGHCALTIPLLHLVAELVPVIKLLDFLKIRLVTTIPVRGRDGGDVTPALAELPGPLEMGCPTAFHAGDVWIPKADVEVLQVPRGHAQLQLQQSLFFPAVEG